MPSLRYQDIIQQPHLLHEADTELLKSWVEHYPHVPLFRALLAAKGRLEASPEAAGWLETAAIYVPDRRQLKKLIQMWETAEQPAHALEGDTLSLTQKASEEKAEELTITETDTLTPSENEETNLPEENTPTEQSHVNDAAEIEQTAELTASQPEEYESDITLTTHEDRVEIFNSDEAVISEDNSPAASSETLEEEINWSLEDENFLKAIGKWEATPTLNEKPELKDDWLLEPPGRKFHVLKLTDIVDQGLVQTDIRWLAPWLEDFQIDFTPSRASAQPLSDERPDVETVQTASPTPTEQPSAITPPSVTNEEKPVTEPVTTSSPELSSTHSFDEWLTILSQKQKSGATDAPVFELPSTDIVNNMNHPDTTISDDTHLPPEETEQEPGEEEVKKMAEESISVRDDFATETLARIYVKQGKTAHAIKVYEILARKNPEKSSYFAALIQQLKAE